VEDSNQSLFPVSVVVLSGDFVPVIVLSVVVLLTVAAYILRQFIERSDGFTPEITFMNFTYITIAHFTL